jgi:hypothetical protein
MKYLLTNVRNQWTDPDSNPRFSVNQLNLIRDGGILF